MDGVYDIVPRDRSSMDVLYDMLSSFDEDSVQIYAGLVRPRAEQPAAPALDEGPASELPDGELLLDAGEPTERITDVEDDEALASEESPATSGDSIEAEAADREAADLDGVVDEPDSVEAVDAEDVSEQDAADVLSEPEPPPADADVDADEPDHGDADSPVPDDVTEAIDEEPTDADEVADEPAEPAPVAQAESASEAETTAQQTRPGRIKPAPGEPEQPSLVDEAGNEPSRPLKRKRARVPSWDEIMFGGGKQE